MQFFKSLSYNSKQFFNKLSIKNRLIFSLLFIIVIPASLTLISIYNISVDLINKKINFSLDKSLNSISSSITQKFEEINEISNFIYLNPELIKLISPDRSEDKNIDIINEISSLDKLLETYYISNQQKNTLLPRIYILNRPEYSLYNFSYKVFDLGLIDSQKWYQNLPTKARYSIVGRSNISLPTTQLETIKFAKRMYALKTQDVSYVALMTIDIGVQEFNNILSYYKPSINSNIMVLDNNSSRAVLSLDESYLATELGNEEFIKTINSQPYPKGSFTAKIGNSEMLISYNRISTIDWTVISVSPIEDLYGDLINFRRVVFTVLILSFVISLLFLLVLAENISYPIRKLVKSMSTIQNNSRMTYSLPYVHNNFDINIEYDRKDEFAYLIRTYKNMVCEIKELIQKLYISEINKKEAELKALQSQINPHFLYNTLDSVNWMALKHNVPDISTMVTSLSDFFRYNLSKGKNIITLADEIKQVESYLAIQQIRFREKLDYSIDIPIELQSYLIVKLTLQPIVENAIIHGIEKRRGKGAILLYSEVSENFLYICIEDNGIGANIEELNSLLINHNSNKSFGAKNVNDRIKQTFGADYGIEFHNAKSNGVLTKIKIPMLTSMEDYYVKNDNS